ncbi:thioredoxin [Homoserinimonas aerilata]|uniref:Thioredoxin n=1 Tax=Homoserinimonas aerilata TaxID=1162970 RepID=A0A542YHW7_9MICO|nr:thioredoxin family protein [Homoserinimonas aerilata]TQL47700.1 thioredoxin [Homoserinimonas aerilata]
MQLILFSSAFCDPCIHTRAVLDEASKLVPAAKIADLDVAQNSAEAERAGIRVTPTIVVLDGNDEEVFRAEGVPTLNQVLTALAQAI